MGDSESGSQSVLRRSPRLLAQLGPRRSARLCAKPARTTSKSTLLAPHKPSRSRSPSPSPCTPKPSSISYRGSGLPMTFSGMGSIIGYRSRQRRSNAKHFWHAYKYVYDTVPKGSLNIKERKHILVSNRKITQEIDKSHGMMWVAVHGMDYICAVFRNKAPDMKRILESLGRYEIMPYFAKHVLWDMEHLADDSEMIGDKPFAVVSVAQGTDDVVDENVYKASGDELDEDKATEFLKRHLAHGSALTDVETIQAAIAGFHYLFKEKLKAEEIRVTFFHDGGDSYFFKNLDTPDIKEYLEVIDNSPSLKCSNESLSLN